MGTNTQYLVEWEGEDKSGKPWDDSWVDKEGVGSYHMRMYTQRLNAIESNIVSVDLKPVFHAARKSVAHAVAIARTRCKPRIHHVPIPELNLEALGMAFLRVLQHPGKLQLSTKKSTRCIPIEETKDKSDGVVTYSITYKHMDDIAAFCQFERHMSSLSAKGALRHNIGRASNLDLMCIGMPLEFLFSKNKTVPGMGSFIIAFPTVHVNGAYGKVQPPAFGKHSTAMLKEQKNLNILVDYIKDTIPDEHTLVEKGWRELPRGRTMLPKEVAVPS